MSSRLLDCSEAEKRKCGLGLGLEIDAIHNVIKEMGMIKDMEGM